METSRGSESSTRGSTAADGRALWRDKRRDLSSRIKDERTKKEIDSICARHERAEIIRRKRDAPMLQSLGSQPPPWKPIAPTAVFGGPVRGFTFSRVCNLRASTPACFEVQRVPLDNHGELRPIHYETRGEQSAQNWPVEHQNRPMVHHKVAHRSGEAGPWPGGQDSLDMFSDMPFHSHFPVVPVYSSTAPLGLNLRAASPVNRMTITGAPSGIAPVPAAHPVVTRLSPDAFVAATRASYQENSRQAVDSVINQHMRTVGNFPSVGKGGLPVRSPRHSRKDVALERATLLLGKERRI